MENDNIVKTEVKLSEESVKKIVLAEAAKAVSEIPNFVENLVRDVLFFREPKKYSYDKENPTFYESVIQKTLRPMIEEELSKIAEAYRPKLRKTLKQAFKSDVIDNKEFEDRLIAKLSKFSSNITFYVSND